jgi:hypothetical protein
MMEQTFSTAGSEAIRHQQWTAGNIIFVEM